MREYTWTQSMPVEEAFDVVVAGGGPAGAAAAVCAARKGAKVVLLEATGCLGGMGTAGMVCAFDPMADGERALVGGFQREVLERLHDRGQTGPRVTRGFWSKCYHRWTPFRPEGLKRLLDDMAAEAGVAVRFFTRVVGADVEAAGRKVRGVVTHDIEGLRYLPGKTFIDATGDAVLADLAGVACRTNPAFMPATLCSLHAGIDWTRFPKAYQDQRDAIQKAVAEGAFTQPDRHIPGMSHIGKTLGYLNAGHVFKKDALKAVDRSEAMAWGRRLAEEFTDAYRKYVPGCEEMELVTTASLLGVRETRRIVGEYELNFADYTARRQFPDQIGVFNKFVDIHVRDCSDEEYARFEEEKDESGRLGAGECFGLPYGILVPKGSENLWVAGRCNSSDEKVHGSIRVMPAAGMMGQAAGTAAAQCLRTGETTATVDTKTLVETLRADEAYLPQAELSPTMTRS